MLRTGLCVSEAPSCGTMLVRSTISSLRQIKPREACSFLETTLAASPEIEKFVRGLYSDNWKTRARAASSIGKLGEAGVDAVPALLPFLNDERLEVRTRVSRALHKVFPDSHKALHYFSYKLSNSDPNTRTHAVLALGHFVEAGHRVLPALYKLLQDPDEEVRDSTVDTLAHLGPDKMVLDAYREQVSEQLTRNKSGEEILASLVRDGVQAPHAAALYYRVKRDLSLESSMQRGDTRRNAASASGHGSSQTAMMMTLYGLPVLFLVVLCGGLLWVASAERVQAVPVILVLVASGVILGVWIRAFINHQNQPDFGGSARGEGEAGTLARLHRDSLETESAEQEKLFDSGWAGSSSDARQGSEAGRPGQSPRVLGMLKHHKINAKFQGVDLFRALQGLGQSLDLSIVLYANVAKKAESLPVSYHAQDTALGDVLNALLSEHGWVYEVRGQKIIVATPQQVAAYHAEQAKKAHRPAVASAPKAVTQPPFEFDMAELEQSDTSDLYEAGNDPALDALTEPAGDLEMSEVLELGENDLQLAELYDSGSDLGAPRENYDSDAPAAAASAAATPPAADDPAGARIRKMLAEHKINAKFQGVDLFRALQGLGQSLDISIVLYANLVEQAKGTPVALTAQDQPLGAVLDELLKGPGWTHQVKDGKVVVATRS